MLKHLTQRIGVRLIFSYLFIAMLTLSLGIISWLLVNQINTILVDVITVRAESRFLSTKLRIQVLLASNLIDGYLQAPSDTMLQRTSVLLADAALVANELGSQLSNSALTPDEQQRLTAILPNIQAIYLTGQRYLDLVAQADQTPEQLAVVLKDFRTLRDQTLQSLTTFEDSQPTLLNPSKRQERQTD